MENKSILWNVRVSKTERKMIAELTRRLGVKKESKAFRYALSLAMQWTDTKQTPSNLGQHPGTPQPTA